MAKKRKKHLRITPEEEAQFERMTRMIEERIAYHDAKAREQERLQHRPRA